ncbi:MAG: dihydroxyacetone kinase subunit DhaK [Elusimicrobiota bacterium]|jgi:dihydroxyacetone kinase-like protein|nr:dihydroxyacetone kinase subunit DhaK [Elusimicrobiota bacterium]
MKKLINDPNNVVVEALQGMQKAHGDILNINFEPAYITRKNPTRKGKVAIISGGGSGHEPLHGGFVGLGMLDAACPGAVFTSPTPDQMEAATKAVDGGAGVIHLVKNYTGDIMNFQMAAEICAAEDIKVEAIVIDDDVAVKDSLYTAGRRGVGSTVLTEKIIGASAERGDKLEKVVEYANYCKNNGRSMGMALTSCILPSVGKPIFEIGDDEIEMGVGIHGEPGRERMKIKPANELVDMMIEPILSDISIKSGDEIILMLNGMGGTPLIELYLLFNHAVEVAQKKGIKTVRCLVGNYITSLEMQGFSITVMKANSDIIKLWDAPVHTAGLRWGI